MPNVSHIPKLLTTKQLSAATGLPRWRIFELVQTGKAPPHLRIGRTLRFPADAVNEWIAAQSSPHAVP